MAGESKKLSFVARLSRHAAATGYVVRVILPVILKTGRRPVIFERYTGMGDIICTIPAALELKKRHVGATFIYNCHPNFTGVPQIAGVADRTTSLTAMGIVGHWYGFLLGGYYPFAHGDDTRGQVAQEPMVAEFLRQFNLPVTDKHPELSVRPQTIGKIKTLIVSRGLDPDSLVLIHPGPSWKVKEWPLENWSRLVCELRAKGFDSIAQLGVSGNANGVKTAVQTIPGTTSFVDQFSIEECFAMIAQARLFIGIDSGLLHIAASTRTPAIGIFGSTLPKFLYSLDVRAKHVVTTVECAGCFHRKPRLNWLSGCPYDIKCMKTIEVEEVLARCMTELEKTVFPLHS